MRVRLLGTAAGGGVPQWNCGCANCQAAREAPGLVLPRTQSSVAVSADGARWFLVNASPDIRWQIESFRPLWPPAGRRGTGIERVLLTNADLDHILGILVLREGPHLQVTATGRVQTAVQGGLRLSTVLGCYAGLEWQEPPFELSPLLAGDGSPTGIEYRAFAVPGKPPRYEAQERSARPGDTIGYRFVDTHTAGRLVCIPGIAQIDESVRKEIGDCDVLLFDGTFWQEDDMAQCARPDATAKSMGHVTVAGAAGSLSELARLSARVIYIHMNNSNPMLRSSSSERTLVEEWGLEIGRDGMEFTI